MLNNYSERKHNFFRRDSLSVNNTCIKSSLFHLNTNINLERNSHSRKSIILLLKLVHLHICS